MTDSQDSISNNRRLLLKAIGATVGVSLGGAGWAQTNQPIRIGGLVALTGSNSVDGPPTAKVLKGLVDEINAAGGIKGRRIELFIEDEQSNPEAAVRAARLLINVQKVSAICATGNSAVAMAVAPLCWESHTPLFTVAGADAVTQLPHQGYIFRTQPNTSFQAARVGAFLAERGAKRIVLLSAPTPFAKTLFDVMTEVVKPSGAQTTSIIYDDKKTSYRSEVDEALKFKPDAIAFAGYVPDTSVLLKDVYRANFQGLKVAFGFSFNQTLVSGVPHEVSEGIYSIAPSAAVGSAAYARVRQLTDMPAPNPYAAQAYDHISLLALTLATMSGETSGQTIRDRVRPSTKAAGGVRVDNPIEGLKLIAQGKSVDYQGASGPCRFGPTGDVADALFRYEQVKSGLLTLVKIA